MVGVYWYAFSMLWWGLWWWLAAARGSGECDGVAVGTFLSRSAVSKIGLILTVAFATLRIISRLFVTLP